MMSEALTRSTYGDAAKTGRSLPETLPHPMTPPLIFLFSWPRSAAGAAAAAASKNARRRICFGSLMLDLLLIGLLVRPLAVRRPYQPGSGRGVPFKPLGPTM